MTTPTTPAAPAPAAADAPPPVGRPSRRGRVLTIVGAVLAGICVAQLAQQGLAELTATTETTTESVPAAAVVEIVADGSVTVLATTGDTVEVERRTRALWREPDTSTEQGDDRVVVRHTCGWRLVGTCRTSTSVRLPEGTDLVVRTSDGDVDAEGALAAATVRTSSGHVTVVGARGAVAARSSDGSVTVSDVGGAVQARTSSGRVEIIGASGTVAARSSDGDVMVRDAGGGVEARTSSGRVEVDGAGGATSARSSDGAVLVAGVDGDVSAVTSSGRVTVHGTGVPVALDMSTSSGRQTVDAPTDPGASRSVTIRSSDGDVSYLGPRG
ncbi:DUF4097 family beta strand repeat-containing protein [Cellulomonas iranensis]|uniref:DUF4097 family beta strand repeat-containing protein n=1 Tax=Cellulomonas iranensis TaxID=76862 RepID=UPI0013D41BAE|nr:DUF4097 family beta strand repeat-containing protein [Cellulomonas iranensis]